VHPVVRGVLHALGLVDDLGAWVVDGRVRACAYPRTERALVALAAHGVSVLVNLHERPHTPARLAAHGLREVHVPVRDFTAPTPAQLDAALAAIDAALAAGERVAVHCGGGLGRTGTVLACHLVRHGLGADEAIVRVRAARPDAVETRAQLAAVYAYARRAVQGGDPAV
jgi:atypical dual specificity phosphatase